ncbi:MAG: InlB B-repeat-containing protein [Oscillospiraceae bacterium]|nr:InlB B-repeat-containing protein [Oscillospiraceae bacterium]
MKTKRFGSRLLALLLVLTAILSCTAGLAVADETVPEEDDISAVSEDEAETTYSYMYKIYTWNESRNMYRPYQTKGTTTSTTAEVTIPTGSITLDNVTINGVEYKFVGWRVGRVGNYADLQTDKQFAAGEDVTADISELASNKYVEVFAVYEAVTYTVTFDSDDGSEVVSQAVTSGGTAAEPTAPTKTGYTFDGWYTDAELTQEYDFTTTVTADITLYAKWKETTYSYRYKIYTWKESLNMYKPYDTRSSATSTTAEVTIPTGSITLDNVTINGVEYKFVGWQVGRVGNYADLQTDKQFAAGEDVTADISELASNKYVEVFAVYEAVTYTVTFDSDGGSEVASQTVTSGGTADEPTAPTKTDYTFEGWYTEDGEAYDFATLVTENITIYAKWKECDHTGNTNDTDCEQDTSCSLCGGTIPATGHDWGEWETVTSPTCEDEGSEKRVCAVCGLTETRGVDATGHNWAAEYTIDQAATCTTDGSQSIHCQDCEAVKDGQVILATGHVTETQNAKDATCTQAGYTGDEVCIVCGETTATGQVTPAAGHVYEKTVVDPTYTEEGYTLYTCTVCGESYKTDYTPILTADDDKTDEEDGKEASTATPTPTTAATATAKAPGTGDDTATTLWLAMLTLCIGGMTAIVVVTKKKAGR